jgi:hypothetical protein
MILCLSGFAGSKWRIPVIKNSAVVPGLNEVWLDGLNVDAPGFQELTNNSVIMYKEVLLSPSTSLLTQVTPTNGS